MLKISQIKLSEQGTTLQLEGRVVGPWVSELRRACDGQLGRMRTLTLNVAEVDFADASGLALLSLLKTQGVLLQECSAFLEEQLRVWLNEEQRQREGSEA